MGALIVVVAVSVAVFYWTMEPLLHVLSDLMELSFLPWVLLALLEIEDRISRLTDLNRWPSLYKSAALPLS
jgi:hypothetical protein